MVSLICLLRLIMVLKVLLFKDVLSVMQQNKADVLCAGLLI